MISNVIAADAAWSDDVLVRRRDSRASESVTPDMSRGPFRVKADPTSASPIVFEVAFSEPVTGFTASDINLAASTAGGTLTAVVSGSGANYSIAVSGVTTAGAVVATIPTGAAQDGDGHASTASTSTDNSIAGPERHDWRWSRGYG